MNHLGTVELETTRLKLRRFTVEDAENMYKNWASEDEVTRFLTWPPHANVNVTRELLSTWVKEYENKKAEEAKKRAAAIRAKSLSTMASGAPTGNINGLALVVPVNGSISSRFGSRGGSRSSVHTGLDICTSSGTGIRPVAAGTVTYSGYKGSYGNLLIIDHGNGVQSYYAHCSALYVSAGQQVSENTSIAAVGSTGNSTGPHLHLEIRVNGNPVNPQNYIY